ncbi:MAG: hypothetical protein PHH58_14335, partial [Rhodoferax sp.]|nr:hypothetical protein [Rhodoferax sp.]
LGAGVVKNIKLHAAATRFAGRHTTSHAFQIDDFVQLASHDGFAQTGFGAAAKFLTGHPRVVLKIAAQTG